MTPRIFIGSASESLDIAHAIQANFHYYDIFTNIWSQGIFTPSNFPIEDLLRQLEDYDFAIFVFTPDDLVRIRNQEMGAVRDNVLFEMGLFIGRLGKERTFFVIPHMNEPLRLPSDILGLQPATYNSKNPDKRAALGVACEEIRTSIDKLGERFRLPKSLSHFAQKAKETNDTEVYIYTFCGLQIEKDIDASRATVVGLNTVYRLWADPSDPQNLIQAVVILDEEPNYVRVNFNNAPGCYPSNVTLRPCGLYPLMNRTHKKYLSFDARAIHLRDDPSNKCSNEIGLSFRLIDELATMWNKGIADPIQERLPVDGIWHSIQIDLTKEWFLFNADGNHYYAVNKDKVDFSVIAAFEIEFGSKGGPRLGTGYGQVEITNIRLSDEPKT